tara:strand:+ start:871 stop:1731 length:861 start_codon:yes stop_codon:yes gene_type:complete
MEIWILLNPALKFFIYIASFFASGTVIFYLHFQKFIETETKLYCQRLIYKFSAFGAIISILLFLSVAGNLGGDLVSTIDITMLSLAIQVKLGKSAIVSLIGFTVLLIFGAKNDFINSFMKVFAAGLILSSFVIVGHSTINGFLTQVLIYIHLIGISYWIGSFLPLLNIGNMGNKVELYDVAMKFGKLAVAYILFLLVAGLFSSYILLGNLNLLFMSNYGNILLMKMVFVILLLGLGALNKYRLVPSIKDNFGDSKKKLTRSISIEIVFALSILFLTSILTTSVTLP